MIVDELIAILGYETRGEGDLKRFQGNMNALEKNVRSVTNGISAMGVAVGTFVGTLAAQAVSRLANEIGNIPGEVIAVGREFENYRLQLETLEGSSEKAEKAMGWIKQFAKDTPLELADVINSYASLRNFGIDPTNGSLMALVDAMAASGKGKEHLSGISLALGQAWAKEKLQGEEILQLVERGIPVWDLLSKATGKTSKELQDLSSKGKLGRETISKLIDEMGKKYAGASEKFAKSFDGIVSKLSDEWTAFLGDIGEKGFYEDIKRRLEGVYETVDRLRKDGTLERWATSISAGMSKGIETAVYLFDRLRRHYQYLTGWIDANPDTFSKIKIGLALIAGIKFPFLTALLVLEDILSWMEGGSSVVGEFADKLSQLTGIDADKLGALLATLAVGGAGLAVAVGPIAAFTGALWPLVTALAALGGVYYLAKSALDYLDSKAATTKAVENPREKPGFIEPANEDRRGLNSNNPGQFLTPGDYGDGFEDAKWAAQQEEAERLAREGVLTPEGGMPRGGERVSARDILGSDYIASDTRMDGGSSAMAAASLAWLKHAFSSISAKLDNPMFQKGLENLQANVAATQPAAAAAAVSATMTDNRQYPVTVNSTVNQTVTQATQAPAAAAQATAQAVGRAASARESTRLYNE